MLLCWIEVSHLLMILFTCQTIKYQSSEPQIQEKGKYPSDKRKSWIYESGMGGVLMENNNIRKENIKNDEQMNTEKCISSVTRK